MVFEQKEFTQIEGYEDYYICKETTEVLSTKKRKNTTDNTIKILKQVNNSKDPSNNYYIVTLVDSEGNRKNTHYLYQFVIQAVRCSSSWIF